MAFPKIPSRFQVLAIGPVFRPSGSAAARQRVLLLQQRDSREAAKPFLVATQSTARPTAAGCRFSRQTPVAHFTHAVRLFCDLMLQQSLADDECAEQGSRSFVRWLASLAESHGSGRNRTGRVRHA